MGSSETHIQPPADAVVLFDGTDTSEWVQRTSGEPCRWQIIGGAMEVVPGTGDIVTKRRFRDFELHLEFWLPLMADKTGQARANSGLYLQGLYEIQILDSYNNETYPLGVCAALYNQVAPSQNAALPPEQWQTYHVFFRAPKFDADGNRVQDGAVTVIWNGVKVHDETPITVPTGGHLDHSPSEPGPIMLQDHGNKIRFRNIWIRPL